MDRIFLGTIHKVTFGQNPHIRESQGYTVGSAIDRTHPEVVVSSITVDDSAYQENGDLVVRVWVLGAGDPGVEKIYKSFVNIPFVVCSDIDK